MHTHGEGAAFVADDRTNPPIVRRSHRGLGLTGAPGWPSSTSTKAIPSPAVWPGQRRCGRNTVAAAELWKLDIDRACTVRARRRVGPDAVRAAWRYRALGNRPRGTTVPVPRVASSTALALADGGPSTPKVFAELDWLRRPVPRLDDPAPPDELLAALATGDLRAVAPLLYNDLQPAAPGIKTRAAPDTARRNRGRGARRHRVRVRSDARQFLCADQQSAVAVVVEPLAPG